MALSKDIVIRLLGDADSAIKAQKAAADAAGVAVGAYRRAEREFDKQQKAMEAASQKQRAAMQDVGQTALGFGATMAAGMGLAAKAAIDWESAWAGVMKTMPDGADLGEIEQGLRDLTSVLPASHAEIAAVAEAAGQLGVEADSIVDFTRTMIDLGETTSLTADEAATAIAQLMNVMGTAPEDVGRLGAALVELGNNGASTESDILSMAQRLSGVGALIGASESDVLALASSMADLGIEAQLGGGVMTRVLQKIYSAALEGGDAIEGFADVAGMSGAEFAQAFQDDPIRALSMFTSGLNDVEASGGNVVTTLSDLGLKGTEEASVLLRMKGASDGLVTSLDTSNAAWGENTALVEEAAKRYDTTAAKMEIARNGLTEAGIEIGETLLPVLADVAEGVADVATWFADLPGPIKEVLGVLGTVGAVGGMAAGAFLLLTPRVRDTVQAFRDLRDTSPGVAKGMDAVGKAAAVAGGLIVLGTAVRALDSAMAPTTATMEQYTAALLDLETGVATLDEQARNLGQNTTTEIDGFADAIKRVTDPSNMERLNDFGGSLFNVVTLGASDTGEGAASRRRTLEFISGLDTSLSLLVQNGNADMAAEKFRIMAAEAEANGVSIEQLKELFPEYAGALKGIENDQRLAADSATGLSGAVANVAPTVESVYGSLTGYAEHLGLDEQATEDLIKKTEELGQTLADFINPLGVYTGYLEEKKAAEEEAARKAAEAAGASADSWEQFVVDTGFSFDEYMRRLEEQVTAQQNWQTNMLILAGRVSQGTLDELARMGPEGAPLVADLVNRSDDELDRFDEITALRSKEATDAWGAQLTMAAPVLAEVGRKAGSGVVAELAAQLQAGTITVAQIAAQYGVSLANGINPILTGLGRARLNVSVPGSSIRSSYAEGGYTGPGGKYDPAGIVHAGEYVLTKEQTSRLGIHRIEEFANRGYATGGFVTAADVPRPRSTAPYQFPISPPAEATMQKGFDEVRAWLAANVGTAGTGQLAGGVSGMFAAVKAAFPEARLNSGFRPGDPGYHGLGRAIDLGQVGRAGGNGHPYLAAMNRWLHDRFGANLKELIYTGAGDDRPDLKNGRPLTYSAGVRATHKNHVHVAMANGGVIGEPVLGLGTRSGNSYSFGERGPETVLPGVRVGGANADGRPVVVNLAGAQITGRLALEADGFARLIDGRITAHNSAQAINGRSWQ